MVEATAKEMNVAKDLIGFKPAFKRLLPDGPGQSQTPVWFFLVGKTIGHGTVQLWVRPLGSDTERFRCVNGHGKNIQFNGTERPIITAEEIMQHAVLVVPEAFFEPERDGLATRFAGFVAFALRNRTGYQHAVLYFAQQLSNGILKKLLLGYLQDHANKKQANGQESIESPFDESNMQDAQDDEDHQRDHPAPSIVAKNHANRQSDHRLNFTDPIELSGSNGGRVLEADPTMLAFADERDYSAKMQDMWVQHSIQVRQHTQQWAPHLRDIAMETLHDYRSGMAHRASLIEAHRQNGQLQATVEALQARLNNYEADNAQPLANGQQQIHSQNAVNEAQPTEGQHQPIVGISLGGNPDDMLSMGPDDLHNSNVDFLNFY